MNLYKNPQSNYYDIYISILNNYDIKYSNNNNHTFKNHKPHKICDPNYKSKYTRSSDGVRKKIV